MKHSKKRGRPKLNHPKTDTGTPELRAKRQMGITTEPLDLCLQKGIISQDEHWAGIHLRWLYTIVFGAPTVSASDPSSLGGKALLEENIDWLLKCEKEYACAQQVLMRCGALPLVPDVCVFNRLPQFLVRSGQNSYDEYTRFTEGLGKLFTLFSGRR